MGQPLENLGKEKLTHARSPYGVRLGLPRLGGNNCKTPPAALMAYGGCYLSPSKK
jgi:hypothetical protein